MEVMGSSPPYELRTWYFVPMFMTYSLPLVTKSKSHNAWFGTSLTRSSIMKFNLSRLPSSIHVHDLNNQSSNIICCTQPWSPNLLEPHIYDNHHTELQVWQDKGLGKCFYNFKMNINFLTINIPVCGRKSVIVVNQSTTIRMASKPLEDIKDYVHLNDKAILMV